MRKTVATLISQLVSFINNDNSLLQPYYLNNSLLVNVLNHPHLRIELNYDLKYEKQITNIVAKPLKL